METWSGREFALWPQFERELVIMTGKAIADRPIGFTWPDILPHPRLAKR
jgi:hypothetical protein